MASKEELDHYAGELVRRFDELTRWAMTNWPRPEYPLMQSDFADSRKEISRIIGPKLGDPDPPLPADGANANGGAQRQYYDVNPAPWP